MLRWIVNTSLRHATVVLALAVGVLALAGLRARSVPLDVFPEFSPPLVEVQTEALGLAAGEVERLVTLPLEELLGGVPWLRKISSESVAGLSSVRMIFEPGTNILHARQVVQERLTLTYTLPTVAKAPVMLQTTSSTNRVMMVGLTSAKLSRVEMSVLAQWTIKPKLLGVPGVANVAVWGERKRQLQVQVDPARLKEKGVKHEQVVSSTGDSLWVSSLSYLKASSPGSGGWIDGPSQRLEIRHVLPISSAGDLGRVALDGTKLNLSDVASVVEGHPPIVGDAIVNGGDGLLLIIEKFPGASTPEVTRRIDAALQAVRLGLPDVAIDQTVFRSAAFVEQALTNHARAIGIAATLLAGVMLLTLSGWRAAVIGFVTIACSLAAATGLILLTGATLNLVVVAGLLLAVAGTIDCAVTIACGIRRHLSTGWGIETDEQLAAIMAEGAARQTKAMSYGILLVLAIGAPLFIIGGAAGAIVRPLAIAYAIAAVTSMFVSLTLAPALARLLYRKSAAGRPKFDPLQILEDGYGAAVAGLCRHPVATLTATALVAVAGLCAVPWLTISLVPEFHDRDVVVNFEAKPGISHPEMMRITSRLTMEIKGIEGVRAASAHIGRAVTGDQIVNINAGQIWVGLTDDTGHHRIQDAVFDVVNGYPGIEFTVQSYLGERVRDALTGSPNPIVVRLYGPDADQMRAKAGEVKQILSGIAGARNVRIKGQVEEPQVFVQVDLDRAALHGLKPGDVRRAAATLFSGIEVGKIYEQQKVFDVVVWSTPSQRGSITDLESLLLETPRGDRVRLGDVATVHVQPTATVIRHEAAQPYVDVIADAHGRDVAQIAAEAGKRLAALPFPAGHHPEILAEFTERRGEQTRLLAVAIAAVLTVWLLFQSLLGSWSRGAATVALLTASLVGCLAIGLATREDLSLGGLVGLVGVLGLAARQVAALFARAMTGADATAIAPIRAALIVAAARERFLPVLTTTLGMAACLLPFVVPGELSGFEIDRPMALTILAGLATSTLFVLIAAPALAMIGGTGFKTAVDSGTT